MKKQYSSLAYYYDQLNSHVDYESWANFIEDIFKDNNIEKGSLVLDLACGTGNVTIPLSKRGYDMIGIDVSAEMLECGRQKDFDSKVLWLCQDMRNFELYGTVAGVICCLDSINYLTTKYALSRCFYLVHNYLDPDGTFIFDVNSPYKFKNIYAENHYIIEAEDVYCGWKNHFDGVSGLCDFELSIFVPQGKQNGYYRYDEIQRERCWKEKEILFLLKKNGFEVQAVYGGLERQMPVDKTERLFFVCKAIK